jgi:hypothetical protein
MPMPSVRSGGCGARPRARLLLAGLVAATWIVILWEPGSRSRFPAGSIVSYRGDWLGRPWTVVSELEFGRFVVQNGGVEAIAEAADLAPYTGPAKEMTLLMAGEPWRHKVAEIRGAALLETIASRN